MRHEPTHIDLFSGIGGFALAAQRAGFRTIAFCEIDKYCQKVLAKNFGIHPNANGCNGSSELGQQQKELAAQSNRIRIHTDIFDFNGSAYRGCDLLTGGFPCQPFSVAGKRRGAADDRHLWPEMLRVIKEARPAWVLGENVPGIIAMELDNVLSDLEGIGYATRPFVIPACAVDARHRRDRLWVVGRLVADLSRVQQGREIEWSERKRVGTSSESLADTAIAGLEGASRTGIQRGIFRSSINGSSNTHRESEGRTSIARSECCEWLSEPDVGRVAHGIPSRVDRLKGLGNSIVPQVAFEILREIRRMI